jgi:glutamyl-tRNA reductase
MAVLSLGISYRRAGVDLLERVAFGDDDLTKAYRAAADEGAIEGAVILSTCNRVELYAHVPAYHAGFLALKRLLAETRTVDPDELGDAIYSHYEEAATEHLFEVAAGLDSMILGEPQILSQVRAAYRRADGEHATTSALAHLFGAAARVGRRVRTETAIGAAPDAFVAAGVDLADEWLGGRLADARATVIGAGQMATLAVRHLRGRGVRAIRVLNRSTERARSLVERVGGEPGGEYGGLDRLVDAVTRSDVVISATGASGVVVQTSTVAAAMADRGGRRLFLLDLAVPRDVDPSGGAVDGVRLIDIEALGERVATGVGPGNDAISADVERAREIVRDEVRRFTLRRRSERLAPLITALRERGDALARSELQRFRSDLASLTPDERSAVEALARGIVAKLLHDPIVRLKERAGPGGDTAYAAMVAELFGIDHLGPPRP